VASAKRGVRGGLREEVEEDESVEAERFGVRLRAAGRFLSSGGEVSLGCQTEDALDKDVP
jgi:hypothetical protein